MVGEVLWLAAVSGVSGTVEGMRSLSPVTRLTGVLCVVAGCLAVMAVCAAVTVHVRAVAPAESLVVVYEDADGLWFLTETTLVPQRPSGLVEDAFVPAPVETGPLPATCREAFDEVRLFVSVAPSLSRLASDVRVRYEVVLLTAQHLCPFEVYESFMGDELDGWVDTGMRIFRPVVGPEP